MNKFYHIKLEGDLLSIAFGEAATNAAIVSEAGEALTAVNFLGGPLLRVNGPASLPVAFTIAHHVAHMYGAIAVFDPKLQGYVVAVSHNPDHKIGDVIPV